MKHLVFICYLIIISNAIHAQQPVPTDYLSKEFHKGRREALRALMPANSVAVIFAYPERVFSQDINYVYHQNPDLYYLTGYKEPNSVLIIFKEEQLGKEGKYNELFFIRKRNALEEQWTGRRLGVDGVKNQLGFTHVYNSDEFAAFPIDFAKFSTILYDVFPDDVGTGMMKTLMTSFISKAGIRKVENRYVMQAYSMLVNWTNSANLAGRVERIRQRMEEIDDNDYKTDPILLELVNKPDTVTLASVIKKIKQAPSPTKTYNSLISALREIKTPEELALLRKSVFLSAIAHVEVMKAIEPNMSETELEGLFMYVHKKYGAEGEGYPPIVGAGPNGCILHYIENNVTRVNNQLVLMDVASEYHGYSADITRTVPANGKFTPEQKKIYQLVYDAQEAVFTICKEGTPFSSLNEKSNEVLAKGLIQLGIIKDASEVYRYSVHGCSHHMGLDVHDKNNSTPLKKDMVLTVEPGIYIPKGSPCDPKWWDIAVRIEDDVIIGKTRCEVISADAPRKIEEIEKLLARKSVFNEIALPALKN